MEVACRKGGRSGVDSELPADSLLAVPICVCVCVGVQAANTLYIDQPVGTGFSYTTTKAYCANDQCIASNVYTFLQVSSITRPRSEVIHSAMVPVVLMLVCSASSACRLLSTTTRTSSSCTRGW